MSPARDTAPRPAAAEPLIRARGLGLAYGGRDAFRDVDLDIPAGQVTAVVGPSGCGKSSFLSTLNRLCDEVPGCRVRGALDIAGRDLLDPALDVVGLRRRVGMIFQKPNPFPLSIRRNVELALDGASRAARHATVERVLRAVGLWDEVADRLGAPALGLSGGQQQRLCFARALALAPEVLLLDEPCSALDPLASAVVEDLIGALRGRYTLVVVTHNLAQARRLADHLAFFWLQDGAGALIEAGPAAQVFARPRQALTRAYLEGARG